MSTHSSCIPGVERAVRVYFAYRKMEEEEEESRPVFYCCCNSGRRRMRRTKWFFFGRSLTDYVAEAANRLHISQQAKKKSKVVLCFSNPDNSFKSENKEKQKIVASSK